MTKSFRRDFDSVDRTTDPDNFVRYLDIVRGTDFFQEIKRRTLALMELRNGEVAIDVGCGTGEDVVDMEAAVEPRGRAVGVDVSVTMVVAARQRARDSAAVFLLGDAHCLPFAGETFDAARTERLLQHSPHPDVALDEIVRIAKPGGRIAIWEGDLDLFVIDAPDYGASRVMQRLICDHFLNGSIGHRLYGMFLERGLEDIRSIPLIRHITDLSLIETAFDLTPSVNLAVDRGLLERKRAMMWLESLQAASGAGRFFSAIGGFIIFGRKPQARR